MLSIDRISIKQENSPAASWYEQEIAAMAQGDMQALCRLYERTRTAVYGFALSILKKPADAEDVLQDTYIRLFHAAGRYVPQGKPMAFIFTITRNLARMRLRQTHHTVEITDEEWERFGQDRPAFTSEDRLILRTAMEALSDEERQIVALHALSGFRHREVAEVLELPLATVLSKYHRALKKLRSRLAPSE